MKIAMTLTALILAAGCDARPPFVAAESAQCNVQLAAIPDEGWYHVEEGSEVHYLHNPPASGPHYPVWAAYQRHDNPVPAPYWVHNLEHGALVILYRPDVPPSVLADLNDFYDHNFDNEVCGHKTVLMAPDPELFTGIAVIAADNELFTNCVNRPAILDFFNTHLNHGPEKNLCAPGDYL